MNAIQKTICASLVLAGIASGGASQAAEVAPADVAREFAVGVNEANAKVQAGDVEGALKQYSEVRTLQPESADLSYNMAVAQYRKGDVAAAEPLFQAAATSENDSLAAKARYNLGNCDYAAGVELSQKDRPAAIEQLESAISNYRSSLQVDTNNADARANIELAAQLIEKLREEQKQHEQQQNEQQQNQHSQDQQNQQQNQDQQSQNQQQNSDQQKQDQEQSEQQQQNSQSQSSQGGEQQDKQQEQQQNQSDSQQSQDEKQQQEQVSKQSESQSQSDEQWKQDQQQEQEQSQESEQNDEAKDSAQQQPQNQQSQSSQQRDQQQSNKQQQPQPNQDASDAEEAVEKPAQQPPQGELTTASEQEAKQNQDQKPIAVFDPSKDGEMTQQEAEKMLQAIRDRDMLRRYRRQQEQLQQHVPVDRDW